MLFTLSVDRSTVMHNTEPNYLGSQLLQLTIAN